MHARRGLQFAVICALAGFVSLSVSSPASAIWNPFAKPKPTATRTTSLVCSVSPASTSPTGQVTLSITSGATANSTYDWTVNGPINSKGAMTYTNTGKPSSFALASPQTSGDYDVTATEKPSNTKSSLCGFTVTSSGSGGGGGTTPGNGGGGGGGTTPVPKPAISVSPTSLSESFVQGQPPTPQSLDVANGGQDGSTLNFVITSSGDTVSTWSVSPDTSSTNVFDYSIITLNYLTNLTAGTHTGALTITDPNASPDHVSIPITLEVSAPSSGGGGGGGTPPSANIAPPQVTITTVNNAPNTDQTANNSTDISVDGSQITLIGNITSQERNLMLDQTTCKYIYYTNNFGTIEDCSFSSKAYDGTNLKKINFTTYPITIKPNATNNKISIGAKDDLGKSEDDELKLRDKQLGGLKLVFSRSPDVMGCSSVTLIGYDPPKNIYKKELINNGTNCEVTFAPGEVLPNVYAYSISYNFATCKGDIIGCMVYSYNYPKSNLSPLIKVEAQVANVFNKDIDILNGSTIKATIGAPPL